MREPLTAEELLEDFEYRKLSAEGRAWVLYMKLNDEIYSRLEAGISCSMNGHSILTLIASIINGELPDIEIKEKKRHEN